jgi:hypothetical protein
MKVIPIPKKLLGNQKTVYQCILNQIKIVDNAYIDGSTLKKILSEELILTKLRETYLLVKDD